MQLVPREAVLTRDGRLWCSRSKAIAPSGSTSSWARATTTWVEIKSVLQGGTLDPGDRVVVSDHLTLAHDAKDQGAQDGEGGRSVGQFGAG